jgi:replicative DNA helicase
MTTYDQPQTDTSYAPGGSDEGLGRIPPQSIPAEVCVLGSMILDAAAIDLVVQLVGPNHFHRPSHQLIFQALCDLRAGNSPVDLVLLKEELTRRKQLEQVGGVQYLVALAEGIPNAANAEYYARIVRDKAMLRQLIVSANQILRDAYDSSDEAMNVITQAEQSIFAIASDHIGSEIQSLQDLVSQTFEELQNADGQMVTGLSSGYPKLDEMTTGLHSGEMIILAARPSMGKTSLLMNMAEYMAVTDRKPIAFFSLEMSAQQITQRLLASNAQFDMQQMRRGMISPEGWTELQLAAGRLEEAPFYIDDSPSLTILQLGAKARRLKAAHDIQAIFVDYLQLMNYAGRADSRQQQITEISRGIKALARELEVPVITAAQLNRGPTDRESHRPRMSDLRESGSIEQDADLVLLLHNEDYYHRGDPEYIGNNPHELIVAKQRNGPTGVVYLTFLQSCTRFMPAAAPHMES